MKKIGVLAVVIIIGCIYLFNRSNNSMDSAEKQVGHELLKSQLGSNTNPQTKVTSTKDPSAQTSNSSDSSSSSSNSDQQTGEGKIISIGGVNYPLMVAKVEMEVGVGSGPNQLGISEEGGGNGPGGFVTTKDGETLIMDMMNDRISSYKDGKLQPIVDLKGKLIKGLAYYDGELYVATGNTKRNVEVYGLDGQLKKTINTNIDTGYLNPLRMEVTESTITTTGYEKTWESDHKGNTVEMYGTPVGDKLIDPTVDEKGNVTINIRNSDGTPNRSIKEKGNFGAVKMIQEQNDGGYIAVYETNPEGPHSDNPYYVSVKRDKNHNIVSTGTIPMGGGDYDVVQDLEVSKDGKICIFKSHQSKHQKSCTKMK